MKNIILSIILFSTILMQYCSAQQSKITENTSSNEVTTVKTDTVKSTFSVSSSNPIAEVYADYIGLKNSLSKDKSDSAASYAKKLFNDIDKVQTDKLTPAKHDTWMKYSTKLSYDAEHIKGTTELEHQREHFISLSQSMYELLKAFNTNTEDVYYQFCPMANNGKGAYWISEQSKISNPYFGKQMATCGSTRETLKAGK